MQITIKYFGVLAECIGKKEELLPLDQEKMSVTELQNRLQVLYPDLMNKSYSIAVNQVLVDGYTTVADQDEVALLPPFAGG